MKPSSLLPISLMCAVGGILVYEIGETCVTRPTPPPYIIKPALPSTWSQSTDNTTIVAGSVSCQNAAGITDNSYWRLYDPATCVPPVAGAYFIDSVTFGVEAATTSSGSTTITVNLRDGAGFPVGGSTAPILCSATVSVPDTDQTQQTFVTVPISPPCCLDAGQTVAVEIMAPNGQATGDFFFIGSNGLGETPPGSSYISAADCGLPDPMPLAAIGFPNVNQIIDIDCRPKNKFRICIPGYTTFGSQPGQFCACGLSWQGPAILGATAAEIRHATTGEVLFSFDQSSIGTQAWSGLLAGGNVQGFVAASGLVPPGRTVEIIICIETAPGSTFGQLRQALLAGNIGTDEGTPNGVPTGNHLNVWTPTDVIPGGSAGPITYICSPANANSTGAGAALTFQGNRELAGGPYTGILTTTQLPPNQFGYYLASRTPRNPPLPVSNGLLCLAGDIGRLIGAGQPGVQNSGPNGAFTAAINTANIPTNPNRAILPGETWYFQTWYRDQSATGPRSNFSDTCCVPFN